MSERSSYWDGRPVIDLVAHPELEPDLGPAKEELENGAEPDDALSLHAGAEIANAPEPEDEVDIAPGADGARATLARAFARREDPELEAGS